MLVVVSKQTYRPSMLLLLPGKIRYQTIAFPSRPVVTIRGPYYPSRSTSTSPQVLLAPTAVTTSFALLTQAS